MNTTETVSTFIQFFRSRGHQLLEGSTLLPQPGDSVLFTSAGMHPLTPFLAGEPHPLGRRLTGVQRCLRTTDLEEVGDTSHLTVFQMLGSWSLGDYDGPQSLRWGMELICDHFGLKPELLHATVFGGDDQVGPDTVALETWGELGLPVELLPGITGGPTGRPGRAGRTPRSSSGPGTGRRRAAQHRPAVGGAVESRHDALPAASGRQPVAAAAAVQSTPAWAWNGC